MPGPAGADRTIPSAWPKLPWNIPTGPAADKFSRQKIAIHHIRFADLGLHPIALTLGPLDLRWYSLAYIAGIVAGWWYLLSLLAQPAAPMIRAHADDLVFYATLGVISSGRFGYVILYGPQMFLYPLEVFKLWDGACRSTAVPLACRSR